MSRRVRSDAGGVMSAPFALARFASMPLGAIVGSVPPGTAERVGKILRTRDGMLKAGPACVAGLHTAVPGLDSGDRRVALRLKRAIHNDRPWTGGVPETVRAALAPDARQALQRWLEAQAAIRALEADLEAAFDEEMATFVRPRLAAEFSREPFLQALVVASPSAYALARRWLDGRRLPQRKARRVERTLLSYLMRAAAKTSPFSTFMVTALLDLERTIDEPLVGIPTGVRSSVDLGRRVMFEVSKGLPAACGRIEHCWFSVEPTVAWRWGGAEAFRPSGGVHAGRLLHLPEPTHVAVPLEVARALAMSPTSVPWFGVLGTLAATGVGEADQAPMAEGLVSAGVLVPDPSRRCDCVDAVAAQQRLTDVRAKAVALAHASAEDRASLLSEIERCVASEGIDVAECGGTVFESSYADAPIVGWPASARAAVGEISKLLRTRVDWSWRYTVLRDVFVQLYGVGGVCFDVVHFLRKIDQIVQPAAGLGRNLPMVAEGFVPPIRNMRAPATVFFQLDSPGAVDRDVSVVINAVHSGCGWLSARFGVGSATVHEQLAARLRAWLAAVAAPALPVAIRTAGAWNELQAHPDVTGLSIVPPGELPRSCRDLTWRDLVLRHSEKTGLIEIYHANDRLAPFYLGSSRPHLGWGPLYWLVVLSTPFIVRPLLPAPPLNMDDQEVLVRPAEVQDRVVLRRRCWWMSKARLHRVWFRRTDARRLVDVRADCERFGIPERIFARPWRIATSKTDFGFPKPLWVDVRHPLLLDLLEADTAREDLVCLEAARPDFPDGGQHVTEFHAEVAV